MKLHEIKKTSGSTIKTEIQPYMLQTKAEIEDWMKNAGIKGMVSRELTIHPTENWVEIGKFGAKTEDVLIQQNGKWVLPVQFHLAAKFSTGYQPIGSMVGFPYVIDGELEMKDSNLEDFQNLPKVVLEIKGSSEVRMKSFKGLEESNCHLLNWTCKKGIDSLDGLNNQIKKIFLDGDDFTVDIKEIVKLCPNLEALGIGGKTLTLKNQLFCLKLPHLRHLYYRPNGADVEKCKAAAEIYNKHLAGNRNILDCQEELMDAGLEEFVV